MEVKHLALQKEHDCAQRDLRLKDQQLGDARLELDSLYQSEDRVKRLLEDLDTVKAEGR